jgi:acyl-CoA synthetase (AMP-forming)/AMP-acid ligase II
MTSLFIGRSDMTLSEMLHTQALGDPEATALICGDEAVSYGELDRSSSLLAGWLLQQGLRPGDRVAIHWCNSIEAAQVFFAAFKASLILVPISLLLKPPEVAWILNHSQPAICFCQPSLAPKVNQAGSDSFCRVLTALPELKSPRASVLPAVAEDEPAVLLYTSGSTAKPKAAIHTHRTLAEVTRLFVEYIAVKRSMSRDQSEQ